MPSLLPPPLHHLEKSKAVGRRGLAVVSEETFFTDAQLLSFILAPLYLGQGGGVPSEGLFVNTHSVLNPYLLTGWNRAGLLTVGGGNTS